MSLNMMQPSWFGYIQIHMVKVRLERTQADNIQDQQYKPI